MSDDQEFPPVEGAKLLQAELLAAKRRNSKLFWTGDESWILWDNQQSGSCLQINQDLPVQVKQMNRPHKLIVTVFLISQALPLSMCSRKARDSTQRTS
jgi:hypothetical protein